MSNVYCHRLAYPNNLSPNEQFLWNLIYRHSKNVLPGLKTQSIKKITDFISASLFNYYQNIYPRINDNYFKTNPDQAKIWIPRNERAYYSKEYLDKYPIWNYNKNLFGLTRKIAISICSVMETLSIATMTIGHLTSKRIGTFDLTNKEEKSQYEDALNNLKDNSISHFSVGEEIKNLYVEDSKEVTTLEILPIENWKIFNDILFSFKKGEGLINLSLFLEFITTHNIVTRKETDFSVIIRDSKDKDNKKLAPIDKQRELNKINNVFPEEIRSFFAYKRIYLDDLDHGGRFFSTFSFINKELRKFILSKLHLIELDAKTFFFNTAFYSKTGKFYQGDFYEDLTKSILSKSDNSFDFLYETEKVKFIRIYREVFKVLGITPFSVNSKEEYKSSIFSSLIKMGLYESSILQEERLKENPNPDKIKKLKEIQKYNLREFSSRISNKLGYSISEIETKLSMVFLSPDIIIESLTKLCEPIIDLLYSESHNKFQNIESNLLHNLYTELIKRNYYPIGIHDAIYIPVDIYSFISSIHSILWINSINSYGYINSNLPSSSLNLYIYTYYQVTTYLKSYGVDIKVNTRYINRSIRAKFGVFI